MTSKFIPVTLVLTLVIGFAGGCKNEPDPRDHPDFNHASADNPSAVKMGSTGVSGAPKAKK